MIRSLYVGLFLCFFDVVAIQTVFVISTSFFIGIFVIMICMAELFCSVIRLMVTEKNLKIRVK